MAGARLAAAQNIHDRRIVSGSAGLRRRMMCRPQTKRDTQQQPAPHQPRPGDLLVTQQEVAAQAALGVQVERAGRHHHPHEVAGKEQRDGPRAAPAAEPRGGAGGQHECVLGEVDGAVESAQVQRQRHHPHAGGEGGEGLQRQRVRSRGRSKVCLAHPAQPRGQSPAAGKHQRQQDQHLQRHRCLSQRTQWRYGQHDRRQQRADAGCMARIGAQAGHRERAGRVHRAAPCANA
jgi:hypothetical protein